MAKNSSITISVADYKPLTKALRVLGETDAPFLREALEESGRDLESAVSSRAPGSMAARTDFAGVKGAASSLRAVVNVKHPGAKSMEFGRKYWKRGGQRTRHTPGQPARPFIGIVKGGHAIAATEPKIRARLVDAIDKTWSHIGGV